MVPNLLRAFAVELLLLIEHFQHGLIINYSLLLLIDKYNLQITIAPN